MNSTDEVSRVGEIPRRLKMTMSVDIGKIEGVKLRKILK